MSIRISSALLGYWRQIFFETTYFDNIQCDVSKLTHLSIERDRLLRGKIDLEQINGWFEHLSDQDNLRVLIAPFCFTHVETPEALTEHPDHLFLIPVLLPAILSKEGVLVPDINAKPWVPPTLMNKMGTHGLYLGMKEAYEHWVVRQTEDTPVDDWQTYIQQGAAVLETVSDEAWISTLELRHYALQADSLILLADSLTLPQADTPLFQQYCALDETPTQDCQTDWIFQTRLHIGQIHPTPIPPDARQALAHLLALEPGQMQSVQVGWDGSSPLWMGDFLASQVVSAALQQADFPFVCIVTDTPAIWQNAWSPIHQFTTCRPLTIRWLPHLPPLGLVIKQGQPEAWQYHFETSNIQQNSDFFKQQFEQYFEKKADTLTDMRDCLHQALAQHYAHYQEGVVIADGWLQAGEAETLEATLQQLQSDDQRLELDYQRCHKAHQLWQARLRERSLSERFWDKTTLFQEKKQLEYTTFLNQHCPGIFDTSEERPQSPQAVLTLLAEKLRQIRVARTKQNTTLTTLCDELASTHHWQRRWIGWQAQFPEFEEVKSLPWTADFTEKESLREKLAAYLDRLRHTLFWLATHYWEACWLAKMMDNPMRLSDWRSYTLLGHACLVDRSSLPTFLEHLAEQDEIDWLVIERSEHDLPMERLHAIAKSKRLIALGDEAGIPPARAMTSIQDVQIAEQWGLIRDEDAIDELGCRGFLANNGSLYQLVKDKSHFKEPSPYGLLPSNPLQIRYDNRHHPSLLQYANTAFHSKTAHFLSLRSEPDSALPAFGYVRLHNLAEIRQGRFTNQADARHIVEWLKHYDMQNQTSLKCTLLTPFIEQKKVLEMSLARHQLHHIPVHTFDSIIGQFYPVVIFSPVYTNADVKPLCFDQGDHWLYTGVQHALDAFWVMGDVSIFDPQTHSPSGYLAKLLFASAHQQLPSPVFERAPYLSESHPMDTLSAYQAAFLKQLSRANTQITLVSPTIDPIYLEQIAWLDICRDLNEKGVKITLYVGNQTFLGWRDPAVKPILSQLNQYGVTLKVVHNCHSNWMVIDGERFIEGAADWLNPVTEQNAWMEKLRYHYRQYEGSAAQALWKQEALMLGRRVVRELSPELLQRSS